MGNRSDTDHVDVSTLGETMLRLSVGPGLRIEDAPAFQVHVGGSESNVAYALASVGLRSSWTSMLPRSPLGVRVVSVLAGGGVDLSTVVWAEDGRLGVFYTELGSQPRPTTIVYDRVGSTMCHATPDAFAWDRVCDATVVHVSGILLGLSERSRVVGERAVREAKQRGRRVSLDVNYRTALWRPERAAEAILSLRGDLDLVVCTAEDARDLFGEVGEAEHVLGRLQERLESDCVVLTCGGDGAVGLQGGVVHARSGYDVRSIDRIGAGDAFMAGLLWGYLDGSVDIGLARGLAMSALKMTLHGDLFTLGAGAVDSLLNGPRREVRR